MFHVKSSIQLLYAINHSFIHSKGASVLCIPAPEIRRLLRRVVVSCASYKPSAFSSCGHVKCHVFLQGASCGICRLIISKLSPHEVDFCL